MIQKHNMIGYRTLIASILIFSNFLFVNAAPEIENLLVEYLKNPLGIDIKKPRFSWQMIAPANERGYAQTAYQIIVTNPEGNIMWDSKKVSDNKSLNIPYAGSQLQPTTRYNWSVTVWDQNGITAKESAWFETGLMNPDPNLSAWDGATWIGGSDEDLVLCSPYLGVFKLNFTLQLDQASNTTKASFIFGANDSRLMDKNKNIFGIENEKNESYIKLELDIENINETENGLAQFHIYRVGYHPDDRSDVPFKSFAVSADLINNENKYHRHTFYVESVFGSVNIYLNGNDETNKITKIEGRQFSMFGTPSFNINPMGQGGDFICFPMLAELGFSIGAGQKASFSDAEVKNFRSPSNKLFHEDLSNPETYDGCFSDYINLETQSFKIKNNAYEIDGGKTGVLIVSEPSKNSMPMLRTVFTTEDKKIMKARLYITSRGIYEVYLNGHRVGNDYFNPGLTQYNKTHMYQTYDITDILIAGKNAIGALLAEGWWSGNITFRGEYWNFFGDRQSLLAKLVIIYTDGTNQIITSNPADWKYYNNGPVLYGSFFQGEVYDALKEAAINGWSTAQYDDSHWKEAVQVELEGNICIDKTTGMGMPPVDDYGNMTLISQVGKNAGIVKELTAIKVEEVRPGVFVYDMGQNMVGVPQISITNGNPRDKITIRYAEVKYPDLPESGENVGMIMIENIRAALAQDIYILKGGNEVIQPRFTFHGYRYLEITGLDEPLPLESVKGLVISSVHKLASNYETSNPKVNKLWENITWSTLGNFLSIPTDCPQRNERMGWSGDLSVFARTSTYLAIAPQFLRRHMLAMRDVQRDDGRFTDIAPLGGGFGGILWGSAGITVAWESYQQFDDKDMLTGHYNAMKKYINFLSTRIDPEKGIMREGPLGDWLSPEQRKNDNTLLWEAYYIFDLELMSKMASVLGKYKDIADFRKKYDERKTFFNKTYINPGTKKTVKSGYATMRIGPPGETPEESSMEAGSLMDSQASYAVPLALNVFNKENEPLIVKNLAGTVVRKNIDDRGMECPEYSLMTGFIGTAWISKALSDHGHNDLAYRLLQNDQYPSWLYPVDQGATTIWERLNGYTVEDGFGGNNSMNSFNHYSFGAVGQWMIAYSLGIQRDKPGFKHFILQPEYEPTGEMTWAKGHYDSMYGRINSAWKINSGTLTYAATIPANTTATLYIPAVSENSVTEGGQPAAEAEGISFVKYENGKAVYELASGNYEFISNMQ